MGLKKCRPEIWLIMTMLLACGPEFIDQQAQLKVTTESSIHSGPGPKYDIITTVKSGAQLTLLESENDWHRVRLPDGRTGWIFRGVAKTIGAEKVIILNDTKIKRGPGDEYKAFAIVKKGKTLEARGERGNWYLIDLPDGKTGWISKQDAEKTSRRNLMATETAKIYQLPNPNSSVLLDVKAGTELIQLNKEGDYYMVRLPGGDTGWIHKNYVNTVREQALLVKERAYVRYGPSIEYDVVETVEKGTRLTLLGKKEAWYEVRTPQGKSGWVFKDFIVTTSFTPEEITIEAQPLYVLTNTDCNIRQGNNTTSPLLARVKKGTLLVKIGQKDNWLKVRMSDQRMGWVREDLISYEPVVMITLDNCNIRLGPSTDYIVKTTVPRNTPLAKISEESGWSRVYLPDGEIGWIRNDLKADPEVALFAKEDCNVRDGPGTNYNQIDRIKAGTPLVQIEKQDNWYKVRLPSKNAGWIREDLLRDTPNQLVTNDRVNIRLGPGTEYRVLIEAEKNTPLIVLGEQDNWYRIKLPDGKIGWIRKDLVSFSFYPITSEAQPVYDSYSTSAPPSYSGIGPSSIPDYTAQLGPKITTSSAVNLRTGPDLNEAKITLLPAGTSVTKINQRGEWYEVQTEDGILGFVHQSGFSTGSNKIYTNTKANLRYGPGTDFRILASVPEKTELTKIEQRDDWVNVQLSDGKKGWIQKDLLDQGKAPAPVPPQTTEVVYGTLVTIEDCRILKGPDETYPTVKSVKMSTQLKKISEYKDWYEVETIDGAKGWVLAKSVKETESKKIIVTQKSEVHQDPNTQSPLLTIVDAGQFYTPLNEEGGWYRITIKPGVTGWIASEDVANLKYPSVYVNTTSANIMRFADEKSNRIAVVKEGVQLQPIDETEDWLFIQLPRGDNGWIQKKLVDRQKYPLIKIVKDTEAYEQPNAGSLLKTTLTKGDEFLALDKNKNWYKIFLRGGEVGWVYSGYVNEMTKGSLLIKDNSNLRMGPGLEYRIITTIPGGEKVKWLDENRGWNQVLTSSGEVGWIVNELAKNVTIPEITAQRNSVVYAGPGITFAKVGEVSQGIKYAPRQKQNGWYQIQLPGGTEGWVPVEVFSPKKPRVVFTLDKANIRSGPGLHYTIVQTIEPAVDVTVIGSEGQWYYVQLQDGTKGYIQKDLVFEE